MEEANKIFDGKAAFNKWLLELTESEKTLVVEMINDALTGHELIDKLKAECLRVKTQRNEYEQKLLQSNRALNKVEADMRILRQSKKLPLLYKTLKHKTLPDTFGTIYNQEDSMGGVAATRIIDLLSAETTIDDLKIKHEYDVCIKSQLEDYNLVDVEVIIKP